MRRSQKIVHLHMIGVVLLGLLWVQQVTAATYYVATTGSNSNNGTIGSPWRDIAYATCGGQTSGNPDLVCPVSTSNANKLTAGDTLYIRGGTYTEHHIIFTNSGTAGNVITVTAYPSETAIVDAGFTTESGCGHACHTFFIDGKNYITLDGLEIMRGVLANIRIAYNSTTTNITITNCNIHSVVTADNVGNIYTNTGANFITITNNRIHDRIVDPASSPAQGQGIKLFRGNNYTIENNEIYNLVDGIMYKHTDAQPRVASVKNNYLHDNTGRGIWWSSHDALISNNLVLGGSRCITLFEAGGTLYARDNTITHNTCVSPIGINMEYQGSGAIGTIVTNNVIANITATDYYGVSIWRFDGTDNSLTTVRHNLIDNTTRSSPIYVINTMYTVAQINTGTPATLVTPCCNIAGNASFVNAAAGNYTLTPGSPGTLAASDGTDMGVCFAKVGIGNASASCTGGDVTPPSAPAGVTVSKFYPSDMEPK